jgi:hypothetical protein
VAGTLRLDWAVSEVFRAFDAAGVEALLLKGASIARWLYTEAAPRAYGDCDLLVRPGDLERAREVLAGLGFEPHYDEEAMPGWWREHAVAWLRNSDAVAVDLHHTLAGVGADDEALWRTLAADRVAVDVAEFPAPAMSIPARGLHMALHAAQHGQEWGTVLEELDMALAQEGIETWRAAAALARALDATPAFAAGLRLTAAGSAVADELGLPSDQSLDVALRSTTPPPAAMTFEQLARARGVRARVAMVAYKLFPPPTFMRKWSPAAHEGRVALARAYGRRLVWLAKTAPRGFRAWRAARRAQRRSP